MARHKDVNWDISEKPGRAADGCETYSNSTINLALLMDIRDELKKLNALLHCRNFTDIPHTLRRIDKRAAKKVKLK